MNWIELSNVSVGKLVFALYCISLIGSYSNVSVRTLVFALYCMSLIGSYSNVYVSTLLVFALYCMSLRGSYNNVSVHTLVFALYCILPEWVIVMYLLVHLFLLCWYTYPNNTFNYFKELWIMFSTCIVITNVQAFCVFIVFQLPFPYGRHVYMLAHCC